MRWIVVLLLVANLAVFAWFSSALGLVADEGGGSTALVPAGEALRLLDGGKGEVAAAVLGAPEAEVESERQGVPMASGSAMCGMIGAFSEQVSAKQVRERLLALGALADVIEVPVTLRTDYWVHMGPYSSREQAMAVLRELQQKGVDSFLIADGELANGVSLGLFRQKHSAESLLAERKSQGYAAVLREIPRTVLERWVLIKEGVELVEPVRNQLLAVSPGTEYRKNPCGAIVSAGKFE